MNEGYVDSIKMIYNVQILVLNPHGFDPWNDYKMNLFQEAIERLNIDIILLNEINLKCNTINRNKMIQRMKKLGRETKLFISDSEEWNTTKYNYLPGGILTVIRGKVAPLIQEDEIHYGKLGNFIVVKVK